jgi:hypothetical protein
MGPAMYRNVSNTELPRRFLSIVRSETSMTFNHNRRIT